ncbi:hypothetical protein S40293_02790, partial [Stachybotrys chartarum IBT 40293]
MPGGFGGQQQSQQQPGRSGTSRLPNGKLAAPVNSKQWLQLGLWRRRTNGQRWPPNTRPSAGRERQLRAELERISTCNTTRLVV